MNLVETSFVFACFCFFTVTTSFAQDVVQLGKNPETGLEEIQVNIAGLPGDAIPLVMVLIPAGNFTMGSPSTEKGRDSDEQQHQVTLTHDFYIGKYEVTQAQWQYVMGSNPSKFSGKPNNPVEQVSWNDCQTFITKLNELGQGKFRLPTEAEWEYACRAGTTERFYWGDDSNYSQINEYAIYKNTGIGGTRKVGTKLPNQWGLFDMIGNLWEWCQDRYGDYPTAPVIDPIGANSGEDKVLRGGCWFSVASRCRSAVREWSNPDTRYYAAGLRLQRSYDTSIVEKWDRL